MSLVPRSKSFAPSPMEKSRTIGLNSLESLKPFYLIKDQKSKLGIDHYFTGAERVVSLSMAHWKTTEQDLGPHSNLHVRPISLYVDGNKNSFQYKNALFSTSLSEVFDKELRLSSRDALCVPSIDTVNEEDEPFESLEETEFQTVGNFLPDEDELLSGIIDDMEYNLRPNSGGDAEDDLFCSGGGMELEADDSLISNKGLDPANGVSISHHEMLNSVFSGEQPFVEHPSRTLLVWNINSEVEDYELRALFERYGDVHTLYTAFKHRGFVMISYYDIRSACNAMKALQNKPLRHTRLEIHFSVPKQDNSSEKDINQGTLMVFNLDSSVSNEDLCQIFGIYGEIKEICRTPHKHHHKFIEFYDVRAAEAAFCALNGSYIAGKRIKLELSRLGVATWRMMQHLSSDLEQEEANGCCEQGSPSSNSPLGDCGSINLGVATSYSHDSGSLQGAHSTVHAPCCPIVNSRFCGISSNIPQTLSSPISATSVGNYSNQSEHIELSHSVGEMKSRFDYMSTPYSRSLCECHDCVANGIHLNSPSTTSSMAININSSPAQGVDNRHIYGAGSCRLDSLSNDYNGGLETSWNGSCPLHGQQCVWGNSNSPYQHPQGQIIWPDSPLLNNISASSAQLHGLPRTQSHMLNIVPPLHHHHVGSTPSVNPSLWERRHAYAVDATNASESHPDSLGSMRFFGCSTLHLSELASPNIFPHFGGNVIDPSISSPIGLPSRQRCHLFHGRTSMIPLPAAFDPNDHARGRRNDAISNQVDNKRQYELDIERIIRGEDSRTTLMIKNIPNKYTSKMLLAAIDERHRGTYDFIYLPIDFKNKCNVGYAFINMIDPQQIIPFYKTFNGKKWEKFNSEKVVLLAYARIQGKAALIAHFQNSSLMNEDKRCRPILFHTDGPNAGDQEPFPMGVNGRSRPGRPRITSNEDDNQQSLSPSTNGEEPSNGDSSPASVKDV